MVRPPLKRAFLAGLLLLPPHLSAAEDQAPAVPPGQTDWASTAIDHAHRMPTGPADAQAVQQVPAAIPEVEIDADESGQVETLQPGATTITARNAFFQSLGTNGRTCFSCHQPQTAWTVSASQAMARFDATDGNDPLFRLLDGATCPTDDISTTAAKRQAFSLLLNKGLIRIGLPLPANSEFTVEAVDDPHHCSTNPAIGLTSPTSGILSVYRRPLPTTSLGFLTNIMWDGREPSLASQAINATLIHAQAAEPPSAGQQDEIVRFETNLFTAQRRSTQAGDLSARGATGGPFFLSQLAADPTGRNPTEKPFNRKVFTIFEAWEDLAPAPAATVAEAAVPAAPLIAPALAAAAETSQDSARQSIARGERLFNTKGFHITGVAGLNDALGKEDIAGSCSTCHDTPNVGNNSAGILMNIGTTNAGDAAPPALDISGLPVFTLKCQSGQTFAVTDPGRALITGKCADIGKVKVPILRELDPRSPYFHNGSAGSLGDLMNFYDQRFAIGFTDEEKQDLVAFLESL